MRFSRIFCFSPDLLVGSFFDIRDDSRLAKVSPRMCCVRALRIKKIVSCKFPPQVSKSLPENTRGMRETERALKARRQRGRIPTAGCNRVVNTASGPLCVSPEGLSVFLAWPAFLARVKTAAGINTLLEPWLDQKFRSNAYLWCFQTVSHTP